MSSIRKSAWIFSLASFSLFILGSQRAGLPIELSAPLASHSLPFGESFSAPEWPVDWIQQNNTGDDRWWISPSNIAGGAMYEVVCDVAPGLNTSRLVTPPITTTGYSVLNLKFKHYLWTYGSGGVILKVQTSADGLAWTDEAWSLSAGPGPTGPETVNTTLSHNLNSPATYIGFLITGNLATADFWCIDDVSIDRGSFVLDGSWTGSGHGTDGWYVGDFNADGRDDIFRYVPGVSGAQVFLSDGTKFVLSGSWTGAGHGTDGWYVGDFDGDGRDDIFRYVPGVSGAEVFRSDGTKFWNSGSWTKSGHGTDGWYVGDFNGDGKDDIFRYLPGVSGADVFLSDGMEFVSAGSWTGAGHGTDGWYVGDFNGDGRDDILRYVAGVSGADVFLSDGTRFVAGGKWTGAGHGTDGWYVGDFNGDGKDDISRYVSGVSGAQVFLSVGTKFLYSGSWTGAGHGTDGWYVGDFDGSGEDDIFRYVPGVSGAQVFLADPTSFSASPSFSFVQPEQVSAPDEDMLLDLYGARQTELSFREEAVLLAPFTTRRMIGDKVSIYEIKAAYEQIVGRIVRLVEIRQMLQRHGYWDIEGQVGRVEEESEQRDKIK